MNHTTQKSRGYYGNLVIISKKTEKYTSSSKKIYFFEKGSRQYSQPKRKANSRWTKQNHSKKGSKNRPKINTTNDYASQIAEKKEQVVNLTTEIASIQKAIEEQKNTLKEKKSALKKNEKEVASLEAKKTKADAKAAEEANKTEAEAVLKKLLASGMSADEILEKLK